MPISSSECAGFARDPAKVEDQVQFLARTLNTMGPFSVHIGMNTLSRRNFFFASSGAAAGSLLVPGLAKAAEGEKLDFTTSGLTTADLKPLKHKEIPGFLSAQQIAPHHTAHYGGALKTFVSIDAQFEDSFQKGTVIDVYEHAFYIDYQNKKADYAEKFMQHVDWAEADRRFQAAS